MTIRERRAIAKAAGKCGTCRCRKPEPGYTTCVACLGKRHDNYYKSTFLECCQSHDVHRFDCTARTVTTASYPRRAA